MSSHRERASLGNRSRFTPSDISRREQWLWATAIGLWFVGDLGLLLVGASTGVTAWTPTVISVANRLGLAVFPLLLTGKVLVLGVAGLSFSALDWEFRTLIPLAIIAVGVLALGRNFAIIRLAL